ncbi:MAG: PEP-CTERM system TPR-repeat protein PrsT [Alphaproteobacteria bacterium]|nr:MAG: PEP-CTERM system TPR-repeat protein PrsT [Alphaproteobacteria bacterium]
MHWNEEKSLRSIGLIILCACLIFTAPLSSPQAHAITNVQSRQAEEAYEKALISFHDGKIKTAKIHLKNALKANPGHLPCRILLAEILIREGDGAGAEIELNYVRERGADYNSLIVLFGYSYILQNKNKYLLEVIRDGNRDSNIEAEISYLRGRAYFGYKKLANARRSYQQALDLNPFFQKARIGLAQVAAVHKRYDLAMEYIDHALDVADPEPAAWVLKAKIYKQLEFNQKAIDAINEALAIDGDNILSRLTRATLYIDRRKFDDAEKDVDFILDKYPREPRAKYLKAIIIATRGDIALSKSSMTEIINILRSLPPAMMNANPTYHYLAGLTNFQFGNLDEARENLQKYLKYEKNDISAMRLLGALELQAGDPLAANVILSKADRNQPDNPTILTMLGLVSLELGNVDKANRYLEAVTRLLPESSRGLTNLARGKIAAGSFGAAIGNLLKAEQHNLDDVDIKLLLAKAYQKSGQYDKAIAILHKLKEKQPENVYLLNLYGTAVGLAGDLAGARKNYEKALKLDKDNITSLIHLSRMDVIEGKPQNAIKVLRRQLEKMPDDYGLMIELGNIYKLLKDSRNALFWYKKAHSINSKDFAILQHLVDGYLLNADIASALKITTEFIDHFPKHTRAYSLRGQLFQKAAKPGEAIRNYELAVEYAIKRGDALLALANAQMKANDHKAARKTLWKAVAWDPNLAGAYIALIRMTIKDADRRNGFDLIRHLRSISEQDNSFPDILTGDLNMALKDYGQAEKAYLAALGNGDNPLAVMGLHQVYQKSGHIKKAIAMLENWHGKYPNNIMFAMSLGNAYKKDGQIERSVAFHEKLLADNPRMPIILNNAASVNFTAGNKDKALKYARLANEIMPDNANILDTLAWIKSRRGNPEDALPLLRKALILRYSDPEIKYHLAMTLDKLGRRGEARRMLAESTRSKATFPEKDAARETLRQWQEN